MSQETITVAVSPFYRGYGWVDAGTGLAFEPQSRVLPIVISKEKDLTGVQEALRLNQLMLLEGNIDIPSVSPSTEAKQDIADLEAEIKELKQANKKLQEDLKSIVTEAPAEETPKEQVETKDVPEPVESAVYTEKELQQKTVAQLKVLLDEKNIDYKSDDNKSVLVTKLVGTDK